MIKDNKITKNGKIYEILVVDGRNFGIYKEDTEIDRFPIPFWDILQEWIDEHVKDGDDEC